MWVVDFLQDPYLRQQWEKYWVFLQAFQSTIIVFHGALRFQEKRVVGPGSTAKAEMWNGMSHSGPGVPWSEPVPQAWWSRHTKVHPAYPVMPQTPGRQHGFWPCVWWCLNTLPDVAKCFHIAWSEKRSNSHPNVVYSLMELIRIRYFESTSKAQAPSLFSNVSNKQTHKADGMKMFLARICLPTSRRPGQPDFNDHFRIDAIEVNFSSGMLFRQPKWSHDVKVARSSSNPT